MAVAPYTSDSESSLPERRISDRNVASMMMSATFASSDGVSWKPNSSNHRCEPFTAVPSGVRTSTSSTIAAV